MTVVELTFRLTIYSALSILTYHKSVQNHVCDMLYIVGAECGKEDIEPFLIFSNLVKS
jgi:hypothetical protein